jgi:hypothetical protein
MLLNSPANGAKRRSHGAGLSFLGRTLAPTYLRRRRRARAYAVYAALPASLVVGCGGRTQSIIDSADDGGSPPLTTAGSSTGGSSGSGATAPSGSGSGGAVQTPECVPELGQRLIGHACSHTTNGPFILVVAGGQADPPDVSDLHRTFEIQVAGPEARVRYRAQRNGTHAFMADAPATFELWLDGKPVSHLPSFPVDGCRGLVSATVYDLQRDAVYELAVLQSPPTLNLFVEHLGAFGSDAWLEACED